MFEKVIVKICDLRRMFPHHDFYFFEDGKALQKAPFYHAVIKSYKVVRNAVFIEM